AVLVNVKRNEITPSIDKSTKGKIREYVKECTGEGKNWEDNADAMCHIIENGRLVGEKDIVYAEDGSIARIKGTEVVNGVLLLKERKKQTKATVLLDNRPIPALEKIRLQALAKHDAAQ
ncbi:hypothetical protein EDD11_009226, partial [Mortierella claussenii]